MKDIFLFVLIGVTLGLLLAIAAIKLKDEQAHTACKQDLIKRNAPNNVVCVPGKTYKQVEVNYQH